MAIIKKFRPNQVFIPRRLMNKLQALFDYSFSVIEAPAGFGKTTIIKEFFSNSDREYIWFDIDNNSITKFNDDLNSKIQEINKLNREVILIFDNYHYIADELTNKIIIDISSNTNYNIKIIVLMQMISSENSSSPIKYASNYIGMHDLQLSKEEIMQYSKISGMKLEFQEVDYLYSFTEGWIWAVYSQFSTYVREGKFDPSESIERLLFYSNWGKFNKKEQNLLIGSSAFDSFSQNQLVCLFKEEFSEKEIIILFKQIDFIHYDSGKGKHQFHPLFHYFLHSEFEKLEPVNKKKIYQRAGDWYCINEDYYLAVKFYHKSNCYEKILAIKCKPYQILNYTTIEDKEIFLDIVYDTSIEEIKKNTLNYLIYIYSLLLYNERNLLKNKCQQLMEIITKNNTITSREQKIQLGHLELILSLTNFNDLPKMCNSYKTALSLLEGPSRIFSDSFHHLDAILFKSPLVLAMYHKKAGDLVNEVNQMNMFMPYYYQVTNGSAKGVESLMHAQALFYQGDFVSAKTLIEKSIYMANTRKQNGIILSAMFLKARIMIFESDYLAFQDIIRQMKKSNDNDMFDLCMCYLAMLFENEDTLANWLKSSETIENKNGIISLGFANLIYGKYLLMQEDYTKLLGISGHFIKIADIYSQLLYQIIVYIYIAIANFKINYHEKALKFMIESLNLSIPDRLYLPFVENYTQIELLLNEVENEEKYKEFIKNVECLAKNLKKGKDTILKHSKGQKNYGLTNRELDVAVLASQRMSNKEIAEKLFIAESTVKSNMKIVFHKLGVNSRASLKDYFV